MPTAVTTRLMQQVIRILSRKQKSATAGFNALIRKGSTAKKIISSISGKSVPIDDGRRIKFLRILPSLEGPKVKVSQVRTFVNRVQGVEERRGAEKSFSSYVKKFGEQQKQPIKVPTAKKPKEAPRERVFKASTPSTPEQSQQEGRRQVGSSILKLIKGGKLLTGRQADARTAKALSEVPKPTGTFSKATLFGGAAGGFLLSKVLGGGGDGGDPAKAAARQKILEVLMGENKRADRQPLIDAQAELARVKVMALLQRIMSQKVATNAAIPFS